MIQRINKANVGIKGSNLGRLNNAKVRAALYYAKKNRLSKAEPYANDAYFDDGYAERGHPIDARYAAFNYIEQGYTQ